MPISQSANKMDYQRGARYERAMIRTAVDDGDGHEDTSTAANGAHKVGRNGKETKNGTTERSSSGNHTLELLVHGAFTVTSHDHLLVLELLGDISGPASGDFNPGLGEDGAGGGDEGDVENGVNGVEQEGLDVVRGRQVVSDTANGLELRRILGGL